MKVEEAKELFKLLTSLPSVEFSGKKFNKKELKGEYNIIDFWGAEGKGLTIISGFTGYVDLSYSKIEEVILIGKFNRVDITRGKIKILDIREAEIIKLDLTKAEIEEVKGGR